MGRHVSRGLGDYSRARPGIPQIKAIPSWAVREKGDTKPNAKYTPSGGDVALDGFMGRSR